jgi:hypothetical protein
MPTVNSYWLGTRREIQIFLNLFAFLPVKLLPFRSKKVKFRAELHLNQHKTYILHLIIFFQSSRHE